jgi:hypothetical protein
MSISKAETRTTSAQRALIAACLQSRARVEHDASLYLADACAVLLDGGWPDGARAVLAHLLDRDAVDQMWMALADGTPASALRPTNGDSPTYLQVIESTDLPAWATYGMWSEPDGGGRRLFGREVLDLRTTTGWTSPHLRVLVLAAEQGRPSVAVEVSDTGTPVLLERDNARHLLIAIAKALKISRQHRIRGDR